MAIVTAFAVPHPPIIVPAVGKGRESEASKTIAAYEEVARRIAELKPETIILTSPHAELYRDYFHVAGGEGAHGSFARFDAPEEQVDVTYDTEFVQVFEAAAYVTKLPAGTQGARHTELDHGTMVPLHFIQREYQDFKLVRMGLSGLSPEMHYGVGRLLARMANELGRRTVLVASGDLSHRMKEDGPYGYSPDGPVFDKLACDALGSGDFLSLLTADPEMCERAGECGLRSFQIMAGAFDKTPVRCALLSHEAPFGVGYGVAAIVPTGEHGSDETRAFDEQCERWRQEEMVRVRSQESPWVDLARHALETFVLDKQTPKAKAMLDGMERRGKLEEGMRKELEGTRAACFVSIKRDGQLRGCIGTIHPTQASLAEEICANAVAAASRDPRFEDVQDFELDELVYDVDVLGKPEEVAGPEALDPGRYGVIVSSADGSRRGLLLPDLPGVDTVEDQVRIAARKGQVDLTEPGVRYERFEVMRHL